MLYVRVHSLATCTTCRYVWGYLRTFGRRDTFSHLGLGFFPDLGTKISAYQMCLESRMQKAATGPYDELFRWKPLLNQSRTLHTKYPAAPSPLLPTTDAHYAVRVSPLRKVTDRIIYRAMKTKKMFSISFLRKYESTKVLSYESTFVLSYIPALLAFSLQIPIHFRCARTPY